MNNWRQWIARAAIVAGGLLASSALPLAQAADFLDPEDAFKFSAAVDDGGRTVEARFAVADGYYLYRERFGFTASDGARLGAPQYPPAKVKFDETFNRQVEIYRGNVVVRLPIEVGTGPFTLTAKLQGCADQGLCYPPETRTMRLDPGAASSGPQRPDATSAGITVAMPTQASRIDKALESRSLLVVLPIFFALGLLLSLTPCVLPMLPILSSIIVGQSGHRLEDGEQKLTKMRGLALAFAYSVGMAIVYTVFGVVAGLAGEELAAALQQPWVLTLFAVLLVTLALSLFGLYELQLPTSWQTRLADASGRFVGGKLASVFAMGALSALLVGPCVAAPLAGALLYLSQTRDVVIGGGALFAMAAGMSVPLLLIGVSAGALLPRAGRWMESVKRLFGVLLMAVALWTISPVIPVWAQMLTWAALFVISAVYLRVFDALPDQAGGWPRLWKGVGVMLVLLGAALIVGAASGGRDVLRPLEQLASARDTRDAAAPPWARIDSVEQLDAALAGAAGKPILVDFYADWCVSCKEMERFTFTDRGVADRLADFDLLRVDVTANSDRDKALLKRFHLFGPPATIFLDGRGRELPGTRAIGFERAADFLTTLTRAAGAASGAAASTAGAIDAPMSSSDLQNPAPQSFSARS
jgi:thiol:disulfide interchange protein DsbD